MTTTTAQQRAQLLIFVLAGEEYAVDILRVREIIRYTTPTRVAVTVTLNPVASMVLAALLLGEAVTPRLMLGLVAVIAGIALANWPVRQLRSA